MLHEMKDVSPIFPLNKRHTDLNWKSSFEKNNIVIRMDGAIFISNSCNQVEFMEQQYFSPTKYRRVRNLCEVLVHSGRTAP